MDRGALDIYVSSQFLRLRPWQPVGDVTLILNAMDASKVRKKTLSLLETSLKAISCNCRRSRSRKLSVFQTRTMRKESEKEI